MKKNHISLIIAIIWMLAACLFFGMHKTGVGIVWLAVGIINLTYVARTARTNKKIQEVSKLLDETVDTTDEKEQYHHEEHYKHEERYNQMEAIEISKEVHTIRDEDIGYEYVVNKAFKPAKSHAGEVELLSTYTPEGEYGEEGTIPYIAVQIDDEVFCAVEEYQSGKAFDGSISTEPLEGFFMFRAKREYYGDIMYFYGFELEKDAYFDKAGLCLVYPKEYIGTENEEKLMRVLDEAAESFQKI